jgi:hypothetical protein
MFGLVVELVLQHPGLDELFGYLFSIDDLGHVTEIEICQL